MRRNPLLATECFEEIDWFGVFLLLVPFSEALLWIFPRSLWSCPIMRGQKIKEVCQYLFEDSYKDLDF